MVKDYLSNENQIYSLKSLLYMKSYLHETMTTKKQNTSKKTFKIKHPALHLTASLKR